MQFHPTSGMGFVSHAGHRVVRFLDRLSSAAGRSGLMVPPAVLASASGMPAPESGNLFSQAACSVGTPQGGGVSPGQSYPLFQKAFADVAYALSSHMNAAQGRGLLRSRIAEIFSREGEQLGLSDGEARLYAIDSCGRVINIARTGRGDPGEGKYGVARIPQADMESVVDVLRGFDSDEVRFGRFPREFDPWLNGKDGGEESLTIRLLPIFSDSNELAGFISFHSRFIEDNIRMLRDSRGTIQAQFCASVLSHALRVAVDLTTQIPLPAVRDRGFLSDSHRVGFRHFNIERIPNPTIRAADILDYLTATAEDYLEANFGIPRDLFRGCYLQADHLFALWNTSQTPFTLDGIAAADIRELPQDNEETPRMKHLNIRALYVPWKGPDHPYKEAFYKLATMMGAQALEFADAAWVTYRTRLEPIMNIAAAFDEGTVWPWVGRELTDAYRPLTEYLYERAWPGLLSSGAITLEKPVLSGVYRDVRFPDIPRSTPVSDYVREALSQDPTAAAFVVGRLSRESRFFQKIEQYEGQSR